jgi:hypothetical protein
MLEDLTEGHQIQLFETLASYLTGQRDFSPQKIIMGAQKWFCGRG